jgi:hypothetical protein
MEDVLGKEIAIRNSNTIFKLPESRNSQTFVIGCNTTTSSHTFTPVDQSDFQNLLQTVKDISKRLENIEERLVALEYAPGSYNYQEAKVDFESLQTIKMEYN